MKFKLILAVSLLLGLGGAVRAQDTQAAPAPQPATPAPQYTEPQLVEEFGWFMAKRVGIAELGFDKQQIDALVKGIVAAAEGKDTPYELEKIGPAMDEFMQRKQTAYMSKLKQQGEAETATFFAEVKKKPGVVVLPSGLVYEIEQQGEGPTPKPTDTVKVHYTGKLVNGTTFDSSVQRGEPVEFQLDQVIPGWTEGLQKISKGGKIKLYIPPQLGYGDEGRPQIPPASTLVFDVELLEIKPAAAAAATEAPAPAPAK
ncbi:FKBP-type peptidyl-prolyl cis-trans isomerase [Opitutus terrae]|uniref:Peptidyl-prolyl cis-trans isomerase n=1 Tax=Opitutus terrae (strain DSM 11246 / JCM 15787 / PB90-1) TaxID=452637 RepID=B1ZZW3_OPITP|nr:FKBP-type peptidyl-prolyl cis-trans isomerase [Opitutus terrae]ACB77296.1 peptidylprolyl isomerase FKBP-type [Opitutus terrae PB90-1]